MTGGYRTATVPGPMGTHVPESGGSGHNRPVNIRTPDSATGLPLRDTRYRDLERYPEFEFVTAWLRDYVNSTVQTPRISEREYWSVECLPAADASEQGHRLISVYAGDLEVACLYLDLRNPGDRRLCGFVAVSLDDLEKACGTDLETLAATHGALRIRRHDSHAAIFWIERPDSREQFDALPWRGAAAELVSALMRGGRNRSANAHCAQLAMFALDA